MKFTEEEYQTIEDLAALNYLPSQIAMYLNVDKKNFLKLFDNPESQVRYHYERGRLVSEAQINLKLKENAVAGNITAAQIFQKEARRIEVQNIRNKVLFGE
jgi:hypothetical protein